MHVVASDITLPGEQLPNGCGSAISQREGTAQNEKAGQVRQQRTRKENLVIYGRRRKAFFLPIIALNAVLKNTLQEDH